MKDHDPHPDSSKPARGAFVIPIPIAPNILEGDVDLVIEVVLADRIHSTRAPVCDQAPLESVHVYVQEHTSIYI